MKLILLVLLSGMLLAFCYAIILHQCFLSTRTTKRTSKGMGLITIMLSLYAFIIVAAAGIFLMCLTNEA